MSVRLPPLNALRAFEAAARHLSFKLAATELNVTPAALSHQVRNLEDTLGLKLFHRETRAITLTDAGQVLYPGISDGFQAFAAAVARLERISDERVLVISVGPAFTSKWLAPRLYRFVEAHPQIDARIAANLTYSNFATDGVDMALRFGRGSYSGLYTEHLMDEAVLPLCSPQYLDSHPLTTASDLSSATLIHDESMSFDSTSPTWRTWLDRAGVDAATVDATRGLRFNLADHAQNAAMEGAGVVLARRVLAAGDMASGRLVAPFALEVPVAGLAFYAVCPNGQQERRAVRTFLKWLRAEIAAMPAPSGIASNGETAPT